MIIENKEIGVRFGVKGNEDFKKWLAEHDKQIKAEVIDDKLQEFAQWLWDSHFLTDEAFNIRLVEQYKLEQLKEQSK